MSGSLKPITLYILEFQKKAFWQKGFLTDFKHFFSLKFPHIFIKHIDIEELTTNENDLLLLIPESFSQLKSFIEKHPQIGDNCIIVGDFIMPEPKFKYPFFRIQLPRHLLSFASNEIGKANYWSVIRNINELIDRGINGRNQEGKSFQITLYLYTGSLINEAIQLFSDLKAVGILVNLINNWEPQEFVSSEVHLIITDSLENIEPEKYKNGKLLLWIPGNLEHTLNPMEWSVELQNKLKFGDVEIFSLPIEKLKAIVHQKLMQHSDSESKKIPNSFYLLGEIPEIFSGEINFSGAAIHHLDQNNEIAISQLHKHKNYLTNSENLIIFYQGKSREWLKSKFKDILKYEGSMGGIRYKNKLVVANEKLEWCPDELIKDFKIISTQNFSINQYIRKAND